jgi:hypothetical protein
MPLVGPHEAENGRPKWPLLVTGTLGHPQFSVWEPSTVASASPLASLSARLEKPLRNGLRVRFETR